MDGYSPYNQKQPLQAPGEYPSYYGEPMSGFNPPAQVCYAQQQYTFIQGYGFMLRSPEDTERMEINRLSRQLGLSILIYFILSLCIKPLASSLMLYLMRLILPDYPATESALITLLWFYPLTLLLSFGILKKRTGIPTRVALPMRAPRVSLMLPAVFVMSALMVVGYAIMTILSQALSLAGLYVRQNNIPLPENAGGIVLYIINVVLIASILEELIFRGVLMQSLRRFGDGFALVVSAFIFALMHLNLLNLPNAFICGLFLGYFVLRTGSLITGMVLHFANNLFIVLGDLFMRNLKPDLYTLCRNVLFAVYLVLGIIALVVLLRKNRGLFTVIPSETALDERAKLGAMLGSVPMVLIYIVSGVMLLGSLAFIGSTAW